MRGQAHPNTCEHDALMRSSVRPPIIDKMAVLATHIQHTVAMHLPVLGKGTMANYKRQCHLTAISLAHAGSILKPCSWAPAATKAAGNFNLAVREAPGCWKHSILSEPTQKS